MVLVHGYAWQAGGLPGKDKCITGKPEDIVGLQTRAAGKAFEQMLASAGASIASMASVRRSTTPCRPAYSMPPIPRSSASSPIASTSRSSAIHPRGRCCPVVHVSAAPDEQIHLRRAERAAAAALLEALEKAEALLSGGSQEGGRGSVEGLQGSGVEIAEDEPEQDFEAWRDMAMETSYKKFVEEVPGRSGTVGPGPVRRVTGRSGPGGPAFALHVGLQREAVMADHPSCGSCRRAPATIAFSSRSAAISTLAGWCRPR